MEPIYIQNVRYKLQKRISRLNSVDDDGLFLVTLTQFLRFLDQHPTFIFPFARSKTFAFRRTALARLF